MVRGWVVSPGGNQGVAPDGCNTGWVREDWERIIEYFGCHLSHTPSPFTSTKTL